LPFKVAVEMPTLVAADDVTVGAVAAVTVNVEPFLNLHVVPTAVRFEGIRYTTSDVPGATVTEPLKVDDIEEPLTPAVAVPKSVAAPPLLEVFTVKVPVPELIVPSQVILDNMKLWVASAVMVI
jgi:hypothetical protein